MRGLVALAVLLWTTQGLSQPSAFIKYTPRDGLVNARVTGAYQDSRGRMYFMTYGGLSVYDGVRFRNYTMADGLAADLVNDVLEVGQDSLLIATNSHTINLLSSNAISVFPLHGQAPVVNRFLKDDQGNIYLSADDGLFTLEGVHVKKYDLPSLEQNGDPYLGLICEHGPHLVFGTNDLRENKGLFLVEKKTGQLLDVLPDVQVSLLSKDRTGQILTTDRTTLYGIDPNELKLGKLVLTDQFTSPVLREEIQSCAFGESESWWVNSKEELIYSVNNQEQVRFELPALSGRVLRMYIDREHLLWICTDGGGVLKVKKPAFNIDDTREVFQTPVWVTHSGSIPGQIWYNTLTGDIYSKKANGIQRLEGTLPKQALVFGQFDGNLYAADIHRIFVNNQNSGFQPVIEIDKPHSGLHLHIDRNGVIFSQESDGLKVYRNNKTVFTYPISENNSIESLSIEGDSVMWMALRSPFLAKFKIEEDHDAYLIKADSFYLKPEVISCRSMFIDDAQRIWIGTRYHGIYVYEERQREYIPVHHFDVATGLTDNFVSALIQSPDGSMIVGTQTGIDRITTGHDGHFHIENLTKPRNYFAFIDDLIVADSGRVYAFTNTHTEIEIYPVGEEVVNYTPRLSINEMKVNGTPVERTSTSFAYQENNLLLNLSAPTFVDEKQVKYSYFLEGGTQQTWSEASYTNATIHLLNLRPGDYRINLRAIFPSTSYPSAQLQYSFTIHPPWWQTIPARVAVIMLFLFMVWMGMRFITKRKLEKQQVALDKQRAIREERSRISGDLHDDLGAGLSSIRFLAEKIRHSKGPVPKAEIEKIQSTSDALTDKMNEIIWAMSEQHDTLEDLISYTRSYAASYCDDHDLICHIQQPDEIPQFFVSGRVRRNIFLCVKEVLHNIVKHAQAKNVYLQIALDDALHISVRDDGKGMYDNTRHTLGHGVRNLERRVTDMGGQISFKNTPGLTVQFSVPMNAKVISGI